MSYNSKQYLAYQEQQFNEPVKGTRARKQPKRAFIEKWEALTIMRLQMGEAEFQRRLKEDETK